MTGTRRDDGFKLLWWVGDFQQRLETVALPRALLDNQPQSLFLINHIRRKDKARDLRWRGQFVQWFGLRRQWTRLILAVQNALIEFRRVRVCPFDRSHDHLIVLALMLVGQRPHVHAAAVFR